MSMHLVATPSWYLAVYCNGSNFTPSAFYYKSEVRERNVILAGASNLKYSTGHFSCKEMIFVDISLPGWTANAENIEKLAPAVKEHVRLGTKAFIFDLIRNTSVRFYQFDGSTSLPFKIQR
jgi:hypothetical protein